MKILNWNVSVLALYQMCKDILKVDSEEHQMSITAAAHEQKLDLDTFAVQPAYHQLMFDFFSSSNLLLINHPDHLLKRKLWKEHLSALSVNSSQAIQEIADGHFSDWHHEEQIDLDKSMRNLLWWVLLKIFLQLLLSDKFYILIESLQEDLLCKQFSLIFMSININFWQFSQSKD